MNGLSLGGVGRETQVDHIEIMNNVDDGIEIWGGTVCMKYISVWNIGDDSLDCDQGWRGKVQHGLIVQGYSAEAKQGSGFGDNCIEMDGSEDSDCEPHTTSTLYNFTVIGNPTKGDHGLALRDNVRLQVRNSIFMDVPDVLIDEESDGDGGSGWNFAQEILLTVMVNTQRVQHLNQCLTWKTPMVSLTTQMPQLVICLVLQRQVSRAQAFTGRRRMGI